MQSHLSGVPLVVGLSAGSSALLSYFADATNRTYNDEVEKIADYANYNYWKRNSGALNFIFDPVQDQRWSPEFVRNIINLYMNTVLADPTFPEYTAYDENIRNTVLARLVKESGGAYYARDLGYIMDATNYAVSDGTVVTLALLLPRTASEKVMQYQTPEIVTTSLQQYNEDRDKGFIENLNDLAKTVTTTLLVVGGVVGGIFLLNNTQGLLKRA